ncbi:CmlA/FloR family chloramphenicol efflux MFS transporter [Stenotrophomonas mori]|uniref:Bcr/CflA family efflux transporter n=1 Tax=Stenotrophomonas mori TaxID=2871096 RepID=A0ABT0SI03_9GAMM|nr:CmlA/FloR family chloramphenicol efflux MFS transporter [Stenotrophomonas mori]MCL7714703.1 CmlA/FloR family chloramphenicol efflux MFS transporter [Stenotrophomonas mori]
MPVHPARSWAHPLPSALLLMVPFDLLASLAMDIYLPVIPHMPAALGTSATLVQLTLSSYLLVLGTGQLLFGPLSDRCGRRPVLLGGALLFTLASFALALAHTGGVFLGLRVLQALGASAALVATFATVRDVYADTPQGRTVYGLFSAILAFVPALGPILGAALALGLGWRGIFAALGALGAIAVGRAWPRWSETRPPAGPRRPPAWGAVLHRRAFWVYTLGFSAAMGSFFVFFSIAPRLLMTGAGLSRMAFSLAFASVALVMVAVTRLAGRAAGRWGVAGCCGRGALLVMAGAIALGLCAATMPPSFVSVVVPMWGIAAGIVLMVSVTAEGALAGSGDHAGTAVALYYALQSLLVTGLGTLWIVWLGGDSVRPLLVQALAMPALCLLGLRWLAEGRRGGR